MSIEERRRILAKDKICLLDCLAIMPWPALADSLLVTVKGMEPGKGTLRVGVFDEAHREEFPSGEYSHSIALPAAAEELTVEVPNLDSGRYAVAVFQDLDEDKKLD